jgi:hypothetical protein
MSGGGGEVSGGGGEASAMTPASGGGGGGGGWSTPTPVRVATAEPPGLAIAVKMPARWPGEVGMNPMLTVQVPPDGSAAVQPLVLRKKSPVLVMETAPVATGPELPTVKSR